MDLFSPIKLDQKLYQKVTLLYIIYSDTKESKSAQCNGKRCHVCQYIEETCEFEDADGNKYDIRKGVINCNTDFTVYKFHCSSCSKQYISISIDI